MREVTVLLQHVDFRFLKTNSFGGSKQNADQPELFNRLLSCLLYKLNCKLSPYLIYRRTNSQQHKFELRTRQRCQPATEMPTHDRCAYSQHDRNANSRQMCLLTTRQKRLLTTRQMCLLTTRQKRLLTTRQKCPFTTFTTSALSSL